MNRVLASSELKEIKNKQATVDELLIIDMSIESYPDLVSQRYKKTLKIYFIDCYFNGVIQLSSILHKHSKIKILHILSDSSQSQLKLGNTVLDHVNLVDYAPKISSWSEFFHSHAEIKIYGDDIASTIKDQSFLSMLSKVTSMTITTSNDL